MERNNKQLSSIVTSAMMEDILTNKTIGEKFKLIDAKVDEFGNTTVMVSYRLPFNRMVKNHLLDVVNEDAWQADPNDLEEQDRITEGYGLAEEIGNMRNSYAPLCQIRISYKKGEEFGYVGGEKVFISKKIFNRRLKEFLGSERYEEYLWFVQYSDSYYEERYGQPFWKW